MNRYDAFLQVLERGTFSDAARAMGYTQSAVSQMVKNLEEELGVTMLVRSRTGVTLTREGELLLPSIRGVANARQLLYALRPYLKPERQDKVERALQLARLFHLGRQFLAGWEG